MSKTNYTYGSFYDLDRIKSIPILDICRVYNIPVTERGGNYWCKIRDERTNSVLLHTDTRYNTYIDFGGTNRKSDVIQFVCEITGKDRGEAIKDLADTFHVNPNNREKNSNELNNWEYKKIGLYGDLATKNLGLNLETQSIEEIREKSEKYGMPMNDLRKKYPEVYEQLLWDKAIPYILDLRNAYYLNVIYTHLTAKAFGIEDFTQVPDAMSSIESDIKDLRTAEKLFQKAAEKTSIVAMPVGEYEPVADLQKILAGEITPGTGKFSYTEMQALAEEKHTTIKYRPVPSDSFCSMDLDAYPYSAFYKGDKVFVGYLESEYRALKPILDKMCGKQPLGEKIADAEGKKDTPARPTEPNKHYQAQR